MILFTDILKASQEAHEQNLPPVVSLQIRPYQLAYAAPFRTSRGIFTHRKGTHLVATLADGTWGVGDAAAWPGFGSNDAAIDAGLADLKRRLPSKLFPAALDAYLQPSVASAPEAVSAVETACLDAWSRSQNIPLAQFLGADADASVFSHALADNAYQAQRAARAGARAIKVKVGLGPLADEVTRVGAIRAAIGDTVGLRLDANGAWPMEVAERAMRLFSAFSPEWLEEPVQPGDAEALVHLGALANVPLAVDESLGSLEAFERLLELKAARVFVLKPLFLGGPTRTLGAIRRAQKAGVTVCVTHAMESGIGCAMALHVALAAGLTTPCGLAPTRFRGESQSALALNYTFPCPTASGLGFWPVGPV